jgi:pimeloyl-ACP methyl ester carboxylesterase
MFHDLASLELMEKHMTGKTKAVAVPEAGHWLYLHQEDICFKQIQEFIFGNN